MSFVPSSASTVTVSVISANRVLGVPQAAFLEPHIPGTTYSDTPCLCFLVEHTQEDKETRILFDLGVRKNLDAGPPSVANAIRDMEIAIETPRDMEQILAERNLTPGDIDTIVLSHSHFDHVGDIGAFPRTTSMVVGPGARQKLVPGYPIQPESTVLDVDLDRSIYEMDFTKVSLSIKGLRAIDFFGDGSFYLLDTPGHAAGHMSALARNTLGHPNGSEDSFLLLAGDVCHHAGSLRPSEHLELSSGTIHRALGHDCFSDTLLGASTMDQSRKHPFYTPSSGGFNEDSKGMVKTLRLIQDFDADPREFVMLAHDHWLLDVVDLFPQCANDWYRKGWADAERWQFLRDFKLN